jgi:ABC-type transport system involved in multi-copper enzyme maturation permease subunit
MPITPFSHNTLMLLNIILASIHIVLSSILLVLVIRKVKLPSYVLPGFLIVSIIACSLILLYSFDCKSMKMNE